MDITLDKRVHVIQVPILSMFPRQCDSLRVSASKDPLHEGISNRCWDRPWRFSGKHLFQEGWLLAMQFRLGQRHQADHFHASGERIGDTGESHQVGRPCKKKATRARVQIYRSLNREEEIGRTLYFVNGGSVQTTQLTGRVG